MAGSLSFRNRIFILVLLVAVIPLGLVGLWLAWGTTRSGEALLKERAETALEATVEEVVSRWIPQKTKILDLSEDSSLEKALGQTSWRNSPPESFEAVFRSLPPLVREAVVYGRDGRVRWSVRREKSSDGTDGRVDYVEPPSEASSVRYRMPVWTGLTDERVGTVEAFVDPEAFLSLSGIPPAAAGMVIGLSDPETGRALRPLPFDPSLIAEPEFQWGGERWVTLRRRLRDPPLTVVVAAPASPLVRPFQRVARQGTVFLALVLFLGLIAAVAFSRRMTRSLEGLSEAAQAVADGDFGRRVSGEGGSEVTRVAEAFNQMTGNLQRTLDELSRKESLAAVGEFAASLAHEIRNPLTAVRIDLQKALDGISGESELRAPLERALGEVDRLNLTIEDTLAQARIGRAGAEAVELQGVLVSAGEAARPFFLERGADLIVGSGGNGVMLRGDADALRQLFLNLFRNAAEALGPGGRATATVSREEESIQVVVEDNGPGIPAELQGRVFEPLFTTRTEGTGLGLAIVKRIAEAHGGEVGLASREGQGTRVVVRLPGM